MGQEVSMMNSPRVVIECSLCLQYGVLWKAHDGHNFQCYMTGVHAIYAHVMCCLHKHENAFRIHNVMRMRMN